MARRLVRLLAGDLTAESVLGEGSTFSLCLPLHPSVAATDWHRGEHSVGTRL